MFPYQPIDKAIPVPSPDAGDFCLTFDGKWLPILFGLLQTLTYPATWQDPAAGIDHASLLIEAFMDAKICPAPPGGGIDVEDCMGCCLRWSDTGVLQTLSCGEWVDVPGKAGNALANGSQPAQGVSQPSAGECRDFIGKVLFFGRWLLPIPVNSGDQIIVNNTFGATTDYIIDYPGWKCGDGTEFIAGGCLSGSAGFSAGDPAPAFHHANLIGFDGTNYYDFGDSANAIPVTVTIQPGISNQNFALLINSAGPAGAGDLSFDIRYCKPTASPLVIAYAVGSGATAVNSGDVVLMTFVNEGPDNGLDFTASELVKMTVVGSTGWNFGVDASANRWIAGSVVQNYDLAATLPQDAGITGNADRMTWGCGPGGTTQVQIKIERI